MWRPAFFMEYELNTVSCVMEIRIPRRLPNLNKLAFDTADNEQLVIMSRMSWGGGDFLYLMGDYQQNELNSGSFPEEQQDAESEDDRAIIR